MSVLIKGMEMPTGCSALTLKVWPDDQVEIIDADGEWKTSKAIPVPPHGRLIDADFLSKVLKERAEDEWNKNTAPFSWSYAYECLIDTLDSMPTVIEAEEGA